MKAHDLLVMTRGRQCARCALTLQRVRSVHGFKFKVNADDWSKRCLALREEQRPNTPFDCPDLRAASKRRPDNGDARAP